MHETSGSRDTTRVTSRSTRSIRRSRAWTCAMSGSSRDPRGRVREEVEGTRVQERAPAWQASVRRDLGEGDLAASARRQSGDLRITARAKSAAVRAHRLRLCRRCASRVRGHALVRRGRHRLVADAFIADRGLGPDRSIRRSRSRVSRRCSNGGVVRSSRC